MFKIKKFEIVGVVLFAVISAIVFFSWNNNPQQQEPNNIKSVSEILADSDKGSVVKEISESSVTTVITIQGFSNEIKPLPPVQTKDALFGVSDFYTYDDRLKDICKDFNIKTCDKENDPWEIAYKDQISEYGDLASRFLFGDSIQLLQNFDVDGDGQNETIIGICGLWGNHCSHEIIIIKNNKQVFSYAGESPNILSSENGNGFYLEWHTVKHFKNG